MDSSTSKVDLLEKVIADRMPGVSWGRFPSSDIKRICPVQTVDLHTAFDLYFADIAGYTLNVRKIRQRPKAELVELRQHLSRSFFERYQGFEAYRALISPEATPDLYRHLNAAELSRADLVRLIGEIMILTQ
jgi:hypothetical protein